MAFTSTAFRRNRATEMVLELQADLVDAQRLDRGADRHVGTVARFAEALEGWLAARLTRESRAFVILGGCIDAVAGYRAADELRDRKVAEALADAKALAGLLDRFDEDAPVAVHA